MRTVKQITVHDGNLFALCEDGTIWVTLVADECEWIFVEGPPEGRPDAKPLTLEEQAEYLRSVGNRTYAGPGHHLGKEK